MRKFELNKLVRDGIVADMEKRGEKVVSQVLDVIGFYKETGRKVGEETNEFDTTIERSKMVREFADRKEAELAAIAARETLAAELDITEEEIEVARLQRRAEMGGFEARSYVQTVAIPDGDSYADYYASHPDRFSEITE